MSEVLGIASSPRTITGAQARGGRAAERRPPRSLQAAAKQQIAELIADESGVVAAVEAPVMDTYSSPGARVAEAMDLVEQAQALLSAGLQLVSDASKEQRPLEQQQQQQAVGAFGSKQPQALHIIRGHLGEALAPAAAAPAAPSAASPAAASAASKALEVLQEAQQRREQVGRGICCLSRRWPGLKRCPFADCCQGWPRPRSALQHVTPACRPKWLARFLSRCQRPNGLRPLARRWRPRAPRCLLLTGRRSTSTRPRRSTWT
jgi:hypothetical protein